MPPQILRPNSLVSAGGFVANTGIGVRAALADDLDSTHARSLRSGADAVKVNVPAASPTVATVGRKAYFYLTHAKARTAYVTKTGLTVVIGPPAPQVAQEDSDFVLNTTTLDVSFGSVPTSTAVLAVAVARSGAGTTAVSSCTVTDNRGGGPYVLQVEQDGASNVRVGWWTAPVNSAAGTYTITATTGAAEDITMVIAEVTGASTPSSTIDGYGGDGDNAPGSVINSSLPDTMDINRLVLGALTWKEV